MGLTEMLHVFIGSRIDDRKAGVTGKPAPGYEAKVVDQAFNEVLQVASSDGLRCADRRDAATSLTTGKRNIAVNGRNVTGDAFTQDEDGYFHFAARNDDMIISAGYNIAGPEVDSGAADHEAVLECAVIGAFDEERAANRRGACGAEGRRDAGRRDDSASAKPRQA